MAECKCKVKKVKKEKGFTIIEVALVLAIAGLIFLVVFLAVPALQRNQRDDARKRDVSLVVQAVLNYTSNSRAQLDTSTDNLYDSNQQRGQGFLAGYLDQLSNNTSAVYVLAGPGNNAHFQPNVPGDAPANRNSGNITYNAVIVVPNKKCDGNFNVRDANVNNNRSYAVITRIENGDTNSNYSDTIGAKFYCQDAS